MESTGPLRSCAKKRSRNWSLRGGVCLYGKVPLKGGSSSHICMPAEQSARERLMREGLRVGAEFSGRGERPGSRHSGSGGVGLG